MMFAFYFNTQQATTRLGFYQVGFAQPKNLPQVGQQSHFVYFTTVQTSFSCWTLYEIILIGQPATFFPL